MILPLHKNRIAGRIRKDSAAAKNKKIFQEEFIMEREKIIVDGLIFMESINSPGYYWMIPDTPGIMEREDIQMDIFIEAFEFCTKRAIDVLLRHKTEWRRSDDPSFGFYFDLPYFAEDEDKIKRKEEEKARKRAEREKRGVKHLTVSLGAILKEKGFV